MVNATGVSGVVQTAQSYIYTIIVGIVILIAGFGLGILAQKLVYRLLREIELNKLLGKVGITQNIDKWVSNIISWVIYLVFIVVFLNHLGITSIVLYLVLGAVLMLIILTFLVGLKDVIPNLIGWIYILRKGQIKEGRRVEVKEISGRVEKIGYLEAEIKTDSGDILYVPNNLFLKSKFKLRKSND